MPGDEAAFHVDTVGLTSLYNQLVRAAGDAADTLAYAAKHCDLSWNTEGLLMIFMGPHDHAYENLTTAVTRLRDLTQGAGTQINRAQLDYVRTDRTSAARLDATYPGAADPGNLRGTLTRGRSDLAPTRDGFVDVAEP